MSRSVRIVSAIFSIFFIFGVAVHQISSMSSSEEDKCIQCTSKINNSLISMKDYLVRNDKMVFKFPNPCPTCTFTGTSNVQLNGDVCPVMVQDGDDTCFDHPMNFYYTVMDITCQCTLPSSPQDVVKLLAKQSKDPLNGFECPSGGPPPIDPTVLQKACPALDPTSLLGIKDCAKPQMPGLNAPKEASGEVVANVKNLKLKLVLRACKNNNKIRTMKIEPDESLANNMNCECVSTGNENFMVPCTCMVKTDFMKNILITAASSITSCSSTSQMDKQVDVLNELVCKDIFDE